MITLTPEEEAILRPKYQEYCEWFHHPQLGNAFVMSFDEWWREQADNAKDRAKYQD